MRYPLDALGSFALLFSLLTSTPALSNANPAGYEFVGCYVDSDTRVLSIWADGVNSRVSTMTNELCASQCVGYLYFGTEDSNQCFCGNELLPDAALAPTVTSCNEACEGNDNEICGGYWFISIYKLSAASGTNTTAALQTVEVATTPVPSPILQPISTGPPTAPPTHSPVSSYNGQGDLLQGYCVTPDYVLLDGPTAFWAPVVGCGGDKTDCCPYATHAATGTSLTTITVVSTVTVDVGPSDATDGPYAGPPAYPTPASANQATLAHCPGDYVSVSGGCCPSGYQLWNTPLGGQVPCYSSLSSSSYLVPPAVPVSNYDQQATLPANITGAAASSSTTESIGKPTSAVINIVYAVKFPVQPSSGLSTGAKAGIGVGAGLGGIAIVVLSLLLVWRTRKHKKDLTAMQQREGQIANGQGQNGMSEATSPYAYSHRTELETYGAPQAVLTPGGFVPQEQNGYFQQQQMLQGYRQQPAHQMQGQPPVQYPSLVASSVSPQPTGSDGYSHQTGYTGMVPSSTGSPPPQKGYGHQTGYAAPVSQLGPNSAGYGAPGSAAYVSPNTTGSLALGEGYDSQGGYNPTGNELHHP